MAIPTYVTHYSIVRSMRRNNKVKWRRKAFDSRVNLCRLSERIMHEKHTSFVLLHWLKLQPVCTTPVSSRASAIVLGIITLAWLKQLIKGKSRVMGKSQPALLVAANLIVSPDAGALVKEGLSLIRG